MKKEYILIIQSPVDSDFKIFNEFHKSELP